jgi:hypothetical protein
MIGRILHRARKIDPLVLIEVDNLHSVIRFFCDAAFIPPNNGPDFMLPEADRLERRSSYCCNRHLALAVAPSQFAALALNPFFICRIRHPKGLFATAALENI